MDKVNAAEMVRELVKVCDEQGTATALTWLTLLVNLLVEKGVITKKDMGGMMLRLAELMSGHKPVEWCRLTTG